jgi:hypothetical protein
VLAALFLMLGFDMWPLTTSPSLMKQPVLGVVWTLMILAIGGAVFYAGTVTFAMDRHCPSSGGCSFAGRRCVVRSLVSMCAWYNVALEGVLQGAGVPIR